MFSGIICHTGKIAKLKKSLLGAEMIIAAPTQISKRLKIGSSLNTNGVCLTVTKITDGRGGDDGHNARNRLDARGGQDGRGEKNIRVFMMNETLRRTAFSSARLGEILNLEPSLRLGDEISGHFVFGHVDCTGKIHSMRKDGESTIMTISIPKKYKKFFAPKGSVAINGISLTVIETPIEMPRAQLAAPKNSISVALIPHTMKMTNLKFKKPGDLVNIEIDMLARYAAITRGHRTARGGRVQ